MLIISYRIIVYITQSYPGITQDQRNNYMIAHYYYRVFASVIFSDGKFERWNLCYRLFYRLRNFIVSVGYFHSWTYNVASHVGRDFWLVELWDATLNHPKEDFRNWFLLWSYINFHCRDKFMLLTLSRDVNSIYGWFCDFIRNVFEEM